MRTTLIWRPEPLTARLIAAAVPARAEFARAAAARARSRRVAASIRVLGEAVGATHPLGSLFEFGADPHGVGESGKVLRFKTGRVRRREGSSPRHERQPFLRPTLPLWAPLYRRRAAGAFRGF